MYHYVLLDSDKRAIARAYAPMVERVRHFCRNSPVYRPCAIRPAATATAKDLIDLPIVYGQPPANERGAGAKPSRGVRRNVKIGSISQKMERWLLSKENRSAYLRSLIAYDLAGNVGDFDDTKKYHRGSSLSATVSGLSPEEVHLLDMQKNRSRYLRRLIAWDMSQE
jgi:hypothetical protein